MQFDPEKIKEHIPGIAGAEEIYNGAVCIPLIKTERGYDVLFEVRASGIKDQPGDICFPGGRIEPNEKPLDAAIRECAEELLIKPSDIEVFGASDIFHGDTIIIYPFAVELLNYEGSFSKDEVGSVFRVPLDFFINTFPEEYFIDAEIKPADDFPYERINGGRAYKWRSRRTRQLFYEYEGKTVWGITARIMYSFVKLLA